MDRCSMLFLTTHESNLIVLSYFNKSLYVYEWLQRLYKGLYDKLQNLFLINGNSFQRKPTSSCISQ